MSTADTAAERTRREVEAVWRIEGARIVATLAKATGDLGLAEDLAQDAVAEALRSWSAGEIPRNPGAWLTAVAKRRAVDGWRRRSAQDERYRTLAADLADTVDQDEEVIDDDVLRLVFMACHPVLSREAQLPLTLRVISGLSTTEIARLLVLPVATVQARITRAKKTLAAAAIPFETPDPTEWRERLAGVLHTIYLLYTEGYAATGGDAWFRAEVAEEALRLGRVLSSLLPREPEVHGLVALMEFQSSRLGARTASDGSPVLLADQDRARWDRAQIRRGDAALTRADALRRGRGPYALQAAIAQCHTAAPTFADTDWDRIVLLYEALESLAPSPVVTLNRAAAVSMATGPATALAIVDELDRSGALRGSHLLPSVRGELLARLGRLDEARTELLRAADLTANAAQRRVLEDKAAAL